MNISEGRNVISTTDDRSGVSSTEEKKRHASYKKITPGRILPDRTAARDQSTAAAAAIKKKTTPPRVILVCSSHTHLFRTAVRVTVREARGRHICTLCALKERTGAAARSRLYLLLTRIKTVSENVPPPPPHPSVISAF